MTRSLSVYVPIKVQWVMTDRRSEARNSAEECESMCTLQRCAKGTDRPGDEPLFTMVLPPDDCEPRGRDLRADRDEWLLTRAARLPIHCLSATLALRMPRLWSRRLLTLLQLTRMALVFTAIADGWCGLALARAAPWWPGRAPFAGVMEGWQFLAMSLVSIGLYGFGMSLNDIIDRRRDRQI